VASVEESGRFDGKVSVVTGAARGIGEAYACALAQAGSAVAVVDLDIDRARLVARKIEARGGTAVAIEADVSDGQSVTRMTDEVMTRFGGIDHLVNNAALFGDREPWDALRGDIAVWERTFSINATSVLLCTRAVAPYMERRGGGSIVNQSSVAAFRPSADRLPYAVSKMAVVTVSQAFAALLGPQRIRVNVIAPGFIDTEGYQRQLTFRSSDAAQVSSLPLARRGQAADLIGGLLYLLSDASAYVTGQCLQIDGGMLMR